jgi:1-acyl-sn-glycerol-3-phosphate acyltransferase
VSDGPDTNPGNATGNAPEPEYDRLANPQSADDVRITSWWWWIGRNILSVYFRTRYRAKKVRGKHNIPRHGGVLIVSNHMTNNDPFLVGWSAIPRRAFYMAKSELFENRIQRVIIGTLGAFPIRRGEADRTAMRIAKGLLARGEVVIIFPEGTRSRDQRLRNPYPGAASLGLPDDVTVIPAAIWGIHEKHGPSRVIFGPPVSKEGLEGSRGQRAGELALRMMAAIAELLPEIGGPVQDPPTNLATTDDE